MLIWRVSIAWTFIALAGWMCAYSRNNLRRSFSLWLTAALITAVTSFVPDQFISFGIIFCLAASTTLLGLVLSPKVIKKLQQFRSITLSVSFCFLIAFLITLPIAHGFLQFGTLRFSLPTVLYSTEYLAFLGFPGKQFISADYYPLLPYSLLFISSALISFALKRDRTNTHHSQASGFALRIQQKLAASPFSRALCFIGQHALVIYLLHQPLLFLIIQAFLRFSHAG